jgi:hypothetical protein
MNIQDLDKIFKDLPKSTKDSLFMPTELMRNKELKSAGEKYYVAILYSYMDSPEIRDFWLNANVYNKRTIYKMNRHLESIGLGELIAISKSPKIESSEEAKQFTILHSHKGNICEWCGRESYILHKHHFPIPKSKGGTNTVNICPNCHSTFHAIYKSED